MTGVAAWGRAPVELAVGTRFELDGLSIARGVQQTGGAVRVDSFGQDAGAIAREARGVGIRASVGCPIVVGGRLWGVIAASTTREEPFAADIETQIAGFTELVATAIANAQARQELQALADEQAALRRVATLVARGEPPAAVFTAVAEEVGRLLPADFAVIGRYESDGAEWTGMGSWSRVGEGLGGRPHAPPRRRHRLHPRPRDRTPRADGQLRRRLGVSCRRRSGRGHRLVGRRADHRGRTALGSDDRVVDVRDRAPRWDRPAAGRLHRAGRHRDRQRRGAPGAADAGGRAGGAAPGRDPRRARGAAGGGLRDGRRGGRSAASCRSHRARPLRPRRPRDAGGRLEPGRRLRHCRRPDQPGRPERHHAGVRDPAPGAPGQRRRHVRRRRGASARLGGQRFGRRADHRRRSAVGSDGRVVDARERASISTPSTGWPTSPGWSQPRSPTPRRTRS